MKCSVVIIGGSFAGLSLAIALGKANIDTIVVERNNILSKKMALDGRGLAISAGSKNFLHYLDVWQSIANFGSIDEIRVSDNHHPFFTHFDGQHIIGKPMGVIIEAYQLHSALLTKAKEYDSVKIIDGSRYIQLDETSSTITLNDGTTITADIFVAADGRNSLLREIKKINTIRHNYNQHAITFNIDHEHSHGNIAVELFQKHGPFAVLPMHNSNQSAIVFCEQPKNAKNLINMNIDDFNTYLFNKMGGFLGKVNVCTERFCFPLNWILATKMVQDNVALVADSAHGMHPIAGQGINMGFRDTAQLAENLHMHYNDPSSYSMHDALQDYQKQRYFDNLKMMLATDFLTKAFSNDIPILSHGRRLFMNKINHNAFIKSQFVRYASGNSHKLSKFMQDGYK